MIWNRIVFKLGGTIVLLFLIVLFPFGFVIHQVFLEFYYQEIRVEIDELAEHYAQSLAVSKNSDTFYMMGMMAEFSQLDLYVTDSDGNVLVNSGVPGLQEGSKIAGQELKILINRGTITKELTDPVTQTKYLVSGKPIFSNHSFLGAIYIASSLEAIGQSLEKLQNMLFLSGVGAFFLAIGFTYLLSKTLSGPLIQMEEATRKIARGDLQTRVHLTSKDEIGSLGRAINDLAFDLQRYRESRSEFFSNISHELRTPITSIGGYAKVLKKGMHETEEEKDKYLDIIFQESHHLTRMIEDLFELSKMEEGRIAFQSEWVDVSEVLNSVIQTIHWKAERKGLAVYMKVSSPLPLLYCDGHRVAQIFSNLLENAIRYTEQGSITVAMWQELDAIKVSVQDTGIGIPREDLPYIFERFYRVEKSRSREFGGTGLGLAIVKHLVEAQGGYIQAFSEPGQGTRFEITFFVSSPIKEKEQEE